MFVCLFFFLSFYISGRIRPLLLLFVKLYVFDQTVCLCRTIYYLRFLWSREVYKFKCTVCEHLDDYKSVTTDFRRTQSLNLNGTWGYDDYDRDLAELAINNVISRDIVIILLVTSWDMCQYTPQMLNPVYLMLV